MKTSQNNFLGKLSGLGYRDKFYFLYFCIRKIDIRHDPFVKIQSRDDGTESKNLK